MNKILAGVIGAVGLLATSAQAATSLPVTGNDATQAQSYADLMKPAVLLNASNAARIAEPGIDGQATITPVQWWYYRRPPYRYLEYYHHHHHYRPYYYDRYPYPHRYYRHPHRG